VLVSAMCLLKLRGGGGPEEGGTVGNNTKK